MLGVLVSFCRFAFSFVRQVRQYVGRDARMHPGKVAMQVRSRFFNCSRLKYTSIKVYCSTRYDEVTYIMNTYQAPCECHTVLVYPIVRSEFFFVRYSAMCGVRVFL